MIREQDDLPTYFFDPAVKEDRLEIVPGVARVIGYTPALDLSRSEENAVEGIACSRFPDNYSDAINRKSALKALENNPHVVQRFREEFSFIDY